MAPELVMHGDEAVRRHPAGLSFAVNVQPFGPCPAVVRALSAADPRSYPDPTARRAREAMGRFLEVDPARLVLGNGAAELLWTLCRVLLHPGATALVVEPTFGEARAAMEASGAEVVPWWAGPIDRPVDMGAVHCAVALRRPRVVYLCHPNNPTGLALSARMLGELAATWPDVSFLLDEAFLSLSERHGDRSMVMPDNVLRLRSLTKDHALPGVRVAYAVLPPALARRVEAGRPPWTTSAYAQAAAEAAMTPEADAWVAECRTRWLELRRALEERLARAGLHLSPTHTGFGLVRVGDATRVAARVAERHAVVVRDATSFGLPDHIRVCARPASDVEVLVRALAAEAT